MAIGHDSVERSRRSVFQSSRTRTFVERRCQECLIAYEGKVFWGRRWKQIPDGY